MRATPRRALGWREAQDGRCVLLRPKFGRSALGRWLSARVREPHYRIRLDDVGTFVWKACDGQTSLETITHRMRQRFGSSVEPVEQRLVAFVGQMERSKLLEVEASSQEETSSLSPPDTDW